MYLKLDPETEDNFTVFAISFASELHRLGWLLNLAFEIRLERADNHLVSIKKTDFEYESLHYQCEETGKIYTLFENDPTGNALVSEFRAFDFILKVSPCRPSEQKEILGLLKRINEIRAVVSMESNKLKNKYKLITE